MVRFIIEHMEKEMYDWCVMEYKHISQIVGKDNLIFTNVNKGMEKIQGLGEIKKEPVENLSIIRVCVLDPDANKKLVPGEKFDNYVFGGILGDNPPRARTKDLVFRMPKAERRHLGPKQMSTDTAVLVTKLISDGKHIEDIKFKDNVEISIKPGESVILPYRYVMQNRKPVLAPGLIETLKKQKGF